MTIKVSAKGQIMLPGPLRRKLGIRVGDVLTMEIEGGSIGNSAKKESEQSTDYH